MKNKFTVQRAVGAAGILTGMYYCSKKGYGLVATIACTVALGFAGFYIGERIEKNLNFKL